MEQDALAPTPTDDWPAPTAPSARTPADKKVGVLKGVGIVVTGLVVGALGVATTHSSSASPAASTTGRAGFGPGGQGQQLGGPPGGQGFGGPPPGTQRQGLTQQTAGLSGTVASVGTNGLKMSVGGAQTSVSVSASTVITRNGASAALAALKPGDAVTVTMANGVALRLVATGSGSST